MGKHGKPINYAPKAAKSAGHDKKSQFKQHFEAKKSAGGASQSKPSVMSSKLSELQQKFKNKLEGGRFRLINGGCLIYLSCVSLSHLTDSASFLMV